VKIKTDIKLSKEEMSKVIDFIGKIKKKKVSGRTKCDNR
jgi:hypothetical protein